MNLWELFGMAIGTVRSNLLRTILTMLGVIIGVSSVITLVSIGKGSQETIAKQYESLGTNLLVVNLRGTGRATQLNYDELMQLESTNGIKSIAPTMTKSSANVKYEKDQQTYNVIGTNDRYLEMQQGEVETGRFLAQADLDFRNHVAVIGSDIATEFFRQGRPDRQGNQYFGLCLHRDRQAENERLQYERHIARQQHFRSAEHTAAGFQAGHDPRAYVEAASSTDTTRVQNVLNTYLYNKFKSTSGYNIFNSSQPLSTMQASSSTMTRQLVSVAAISLLVGGIGIMNIMLMTVSERTREIGIRKSIGAKRQGIFCSSFWWKRRSSAAWADSSGLRSGLYYRWPGR
ncbi:ABC transporter permease [Paenibacillus sp. P26]|nr:ABC transporter permease [Paenibacillus sp. P26]